jgi:hypothetical protein
MYTGVGVDDGPVFLPGAMQPRRPAGWTVTLKPPTAPRPPPLLKPPTESTPSPVPTLVVTEEPPTTVPAAPSSSRWPIYIAAGGVAVVGALWLFTRK